MKQTNKRVLVLREVMVIGLVPDGRCLLYRLWSLRVLLLLREVMAIGLVLWWTLLAVQAVVATCVTSTAGSDGDWISALVDAARLSGLARRQLLGGWQWIVVSMSVSVSVSVSVQETGVAFQRFIFRFCQ